MATVNGRIGGLSDEITKLQRTVSDHHSELGSHVTTSKAFVQATTEHQVILFVENYRVLGFTFVEAPH